MSPFKRGGKGQAKSAMRSYNDSKYVRDSPWGKPNKQALLNQRFFNISGQKKVFGQNSVKDVSKSFIMPGGKSIYDLVSQKIDLPQGLLYRGKYCGKSKLRDRMFEYGEKPREQQEEVLSTVNPKIADSKSARQMILKHS